jgi:hypothetical protein
MDPMQTMATIAAQLAEPERSAAIRMAAGQPTTTDEQAAVNQAVQALGQDQWDTWSSSVYAIGAGRTTQLAADDPEIVQYQADNPGLQYETEDQLRDKGGKLLDDLKSNTANALGTVTKALGLPDPGTLVKYVIIGGVVVCVVGVGGWLLLRR